MDDLDPFLQTEFSYWKDTLLAYGLIVLGTGIVLFGIVSQ